MAQTVALDAKVKLMDCPGIVFARAKTAEEQAEVVLRNCVKLERLEEPTLPIEAILRRRLASLLMALLVVGLIWLGLWAAWSLFTGNLRVGFGIVLLLAAIWMAVQTAREGIRSR